MFIGSMCGLFIYMCSICMVNVPVKNPMDPMGFGLFFHDFHMSGSGVRIHNFGTIEAKKQTSICGRSQSFWVVTGV